MKKIISEKHEMADYLLKCITALEYFIFTVTNFDREFKGPRGVKVLLRKKVTIENSLFGYRFFGCGHHEHEIRIPDEIRNDIIEIAKNRKIELEKEYQDLFINSTE